MARQRAVITGGSSGIGLATVAAFLQAGYQVLAASRRIDELKGKEEFAPYIQKGDLLLEKVDVASREDMDRLAQRAQKDMGGIDVLVNNAGAFRGGEILETKEEDFDFLVDVNVKSVYYAIQAFLPMMLAQNAGRIINVASVSGLRGDYNATLYAMSKSAVMAITQCVALDYGKRGIRANAVCPSATATPMFLTGSTKEVINQFCANVPDGEVGEPEGVAETILFLASPAAKHINGHKLVIDGGLNAWNGQPKQDKEAALKG